MMITLQALRVWEAFNIKTFGQYHQIYLKYDIILLADVMEYFRKSRLKTYGLDPVYYFSLPGLSFDACLKFSKVQLELMTDIDQYLFIESFEEE